MMPLRLPSPAAKKCQAIMPEIRYGRYGMSPLRFWRRPKENTSARTTAYVSGWT